MSKYDKPDHWSLRAQREGYPARSVYKLKEMDEKFSLLHRKQPLKVLDLGAAPGSWSLYALRKLAGGIQLSAADLSPLSRRYDQGLFDGENFFFIQGDIGAPEIQEALLARGPYDLILSDIAPATTGNRLVDTQRSLALAESVLGYAEQSLVSGGNLALKIFQGSGSEALLKNIRDLFKTGKSFKPSACRDNSFETYYLGLGKQ